MNDSVFNLEQQLQDCWRVTDDIKLVTRHFMEDPKWEGMSAELADTIMNKYLAIQELYELKFEELWKTFEEVAKEYHKRGNALKEKRNESSHRKAEIFFDI